MHVAIVGCGQLSRMLALAGIPLGFKFTFIADNPGDDTRCVKHLGPVTRWSPGQSGRSLYEQFGSPDVVTAEKEQIDASLLTSLREHCDVHPNPASFAIFQHRGKEKQLLEELQIPSASYLHSIPATHALKRLPLPLVAKSCRGGYDGKNQQVLRTPQDAVAFDAQCREKDYIIEEWVPFDREISIISVRDLNGNILHYPITENVHENGILKHSIAPAQHIPDEIVLTAQQNISKVMLATGYVGVMAMECFLVDGQLLVNEIAPRVHNSGHWTQTGCKTSQFENHLRAIAGLSLGSTENHSVSGMVNLIGTGIPSDAGFSTHSTMHWYNKTERPGRKLGHVNFSGDSHDELLQKMNQFTREMLAG